MRGFTVLLILLVSIVFSGFSQTTEVALSKRIEKKDGKEYYIHTIIKGQTLYSLSKAYNVLISEIVFENPEAIDGIKPDMELRIPVSATATAKDGSVQEKPIEINGKNRIHVVEKGQTLYSVAKLYNVSVEAIKQANVGMGETLSLGQSLNIPVEQLIKPEESINISGTPDVLNGASDNLSFDKAKLNVIMLLPLYLKENKNTIVDTSGENGSNTFENIFSKSLNALEFYEGAKLAADSLSKLKINAKIYSFDYSDDDASAAFMQNPELKNADLIIGPFYSKRFETISAFGKEHNIPCITPVLRKNEITLNNPIVIKAMPSEETQFKQMGDFIGRWNCNKTIIIMHNGSGADSILLENLVAGIDGRCDSALLHILNIKGKSVRLVDSLLQPNKENIVVSLSLDESYVSRLVLYLEKKNDKKRIVTLFGRTEWQDFENIEIEYLQNVNLHFPIDLFVDYSRTEVKDFLTKFRAAYFAEPGKYAYLGYDITFFYLQMMQKYGRDFFKNPTLIHSIGLQSNFDFKKIAEGSGLENQCTFILNYNDYRLVKVN